MILFAFCVTASAVAQDGTLLSGQSATIFRTSEDLNKKTIAPVYEYLNFAAPNLNKSGSLSMYVGGWGRTDLDTKTTNDYHDGDLQYGYLSYRGSHNNLVANLGRQFVSEGVAAEKLDGLYLRSDLPAGFGAAAFVGAPVVTEPNSRGGSIVYGGRLTQSNPKYYTLGLSLTKVNRSGVEYREESGVDVWLHPLPKVDIAGRSSYNSITGGWMEHNYQLSYSPVTKLSINASYSDIKYKAYFFNMTTNVFSLFSAANPTGILNPNERVQSSGGSVAYAVGKAVVVAGDYTNQHHVYAQDANYFGGKATVKLPGSFVTGFAIHRMQGATDALRYSQYRVFAAKKIQRLDLTADFIDNYYETKLSGINNAPTVVAEASYAITPSLRFWADMNYSKTPYYDSNVAGLFKLTYAFDVRHGAEGRAK